MIASILLFRQSNPAGLIFWAVLGLCAGVYLFIQGFRLLQRRQLILNTPISKIRSAPMGLVELSGLAVGPHTMIAPITAHSAYYYRTLVWEWKQQGKNKQWVKVAAECMHVPFFLDDNTGKLMIDPRGADLDLHRDFQQEFCDSFFTTKEPAPDNVRSFLDRHGVNTRNKIKVEEFCIKPKNSLFVLGTVDENTGLEVTQKPILDEEQNTLNLTFWSNSNSSGLFSLGTLLAEERSSGSEMLVGAPALPVTTGATHVIHLSPPGSPIKATEMTQQQKIAAAMVRAGISNPAAWAAAGVTPSDAAGNSNSNGPSSSGSSSVGLPNVLLSRNTVTPATAAAAIDGFELHPPVVVRKGKNNPTFLISWRSQRDVARSLGWKCTLMIWGGPALTLLSVYVLLNILHLL